MIVDLTADFKKHFPPSPIHSTSSYSTSVFMKTSTSYLNDLTSLQNKLSDLEKTIRVSSRFDKDSQIKKIMNVKQTIKVNQQNIRRLKTIVSDVKGGQSICKKLKESIIVTLEMKLLKEGFKFREVHLLHATKNKKANQTGRIIELASDNTPNLSKSHFLQQSHSEIMAEVSSHEYKQIQKSIHEISEMYRETLNVVRMHDMLIDNIEGHIDQTEDNVEGGRRNLGQVHSKQLKNRQFIKKVFIILYIVVFVYSVLL